MRIRNKMLVLTTTIVSLYTFVLLCVVVFFIQTRFLSVESLIARDDLNRVAHALQNEIDSLKVIAKDYGNWDDTWEYARGGKPSFVEDNLVESVYENLGLSICAIYNASGRQMIANSYAANSDPVPCRYCPGTLSLSAALKGIAARGSGFIKADGEIHLVVAIPICHSDKSGPVAGTLFMGKKLDSSLIERIHDFTEVPVNMYVDDIRKDVVNYPAVAEPVVSRIEWVDDTSIRGLLSYITADGSSAFSLSTKTYRSLRPQGFQIIQMTMILFCIVALICAGAINFTFRSWVAGPLSSLENALASIEGNPKNFLAEREPAALERLYSRKDEIGHVAKAIRTMQGRILEAHETVRKNNERLESLVLRRTADLVSVNTKLEIFKKVLENTSEAVIITDLDGAICEMNDAMCLMTGYSRDELMGKNSRIFKSDRHDGAFYATMWKTILKSGHWEGELWDRRKDGAVYPKWQTINVINDEKGSPVNYVGVSTDISVIKEAEEKLHHLAYFDPLTSLPNRMLFSDRLEHQIACAKRSSGFFGLLFIDLDRFKLVNDSLGHLQGDSLLVQVAARLKDCIRSSDTLCRIGGDEFTLILQDLSHEENAGMIAAEVVHKLAQRFDIAGEDVYIGASVGIALFPKDGTDAETLLRKADSAMYLAKEAGRGLYRYASGEMEQANRSRLENEVKMHKALERNEFCLYYQPQNVVGEATPAMPCGLVGAEALLRWIPSPGQVISPADFLPIAEETGFIAPLGDWVLYHACHDAKRWLDMGKPVQVSVNVAARQFDTGNFSDRVASVLSSTGLPPNLLKLEVTESGFMRNITQVIEIMRKIRNMGVNFAIDDFGTGYCSLQYLNRLPVDCLKIDQSFIRSMDDRHSGGDIVSAIISMAHAFGLSSVAEGVETFEQLEQLKSRGCDYIQGFLVSRPLSFEDFQAYLAK